MKKKVMVVAFDIEMSGATLRDVKKKEINVIGKSQGDVIAIGGSLVHFNEETREFERLKSIMIPMFFPVLSTALGVCGEGEGVIVNEGDEEGPKFVIYKLDGDDKGLVHDHIDTSTLNRHTVFEKRNWEEFWSKEVDILRGLKGPKRKGTIRDCYIVAAMKLNKFRMACERIAKEAECKLVVVSDNVSYDIGILDRLIQNSIENTLPFTHRLLDEKYNGGTPCTHSMQRGLLAVIDPLWLFSEEKNLDVEWMKWLEDDESEEEKKEHRGLKHWSMTKRIRYLYNIPKIDIPHDHNPENDAYTIACEYLAIYAIGKGYFKLDISRSSGKRKSTDAEKALGKKRKEV